MVPLLVTAPEVVIFPFAVKVSVTDRVVMPVPFKLTLPVVVMAFATGFVIVIPVAPVPPFIVEDVPTVKVTIIPPSPVAVRFPVVLVIVPPPE